MKTKRNILLALMGVFCFSIGNAQIIYSNNFSLGAAVNISNTPPTYAATYAGGNSSAVWLDVAGSATTHGPLLANGIDNSPQFDLWALNFTPQSNHVYLLTVVLALTNNPGAAAEFGYTINTTLTNYASDPRFNGAVSGYDWMAPNYSGNPEFFAGSKAANTLWFANGVYPTPGTNTYQIILDTRGVMGPTPTNWVAAGAINDVGVNGFYAYSGTSQSQVQAITSVGISQNSGNLTIPTAIQYQSFVLETTFKPFIVQQPVASSVLSGVSSWTNQVTVLADTNGGTLSYQWYANGMPLTNGVNGVSGANTNQLIINPVLIVNQATNYYVIVTNTYGAVTSTLASLIQILPAALPDISGIRLSGNNLFINGSNGFSGMTVNLLMSTNVALPLNQWTALETNISGGSGNFTIVVTNAVTQFIPQSFYILQMQ